MKEYAVPIVIDNGSYKCRVGYSNMSAPLLEFRNLIAKPRKDKRKDGNNFLENTFQIGNEIDHETMRLQMKTQFERNVLTHPQYQEHIFDYIFGKLSTDTDNWTPHPILLTEPIGNPNYCRQNVNELLFECYGVPAVCYGIDSVLSWQHNMPSACSSDALILSFGYHTTHVIPVLNGKLKHCKVRRLNMGGNQMITYLYRLLQMKYPAHLNAITMNRMENVFHNHSFIAEDYLAELKKWDNIEFYNENVKKIQLPYIAPLQPDPVSLEQKLKRRKELARRLADINFRRTKEKKDSSAESAQTQNVNLTNKNKLSKPYTPPPNTTIEEWISDVKLKHVEILKRKDHRNKRRQDMVKRHTLASQERMRIISLLAANEKGSDEFGKDDKDWDVYKKISHENESDSDSDNEKLLEYENILRQYQVQLEKPTTNENTAELYQLHIGIESMRAPELLFQPSMIGCSETGLAELLSFVFNTFTLDEQQRLANNVFMTGGCSQLPGLRERLLKELREMRPFKSSFEVFLAKNPNLDAWYGGCSYAESTDFAQYLTTKEDYDEKGPEFFKESLISNKYFQTPK